MTKRASPSLVPSELPTRIPRERYSHLGLCLVGQDEIVKIARRAGGMVGAPERRGEAVTLREADVRQKLARLDECGTGDCA